MNREVKFRGKNLINGQWIYGGLAEDKEGNFVILPKGKWHRGACVDKDTIGQFTGFQFNGRDIYEHDVFVIENTFFKVVYSQDLATFVFKDLKTKNVGCISFTNVLIVNEATYGGCVFDNESYITAEV